MKKAEFSMEQIIIIIIAVVAALVIISLVWNSVKNQSDVLKENSPFAELMNVCRAKMFLPGSLDSDGDTVEDSCDVCTDGPDVDRKGVPIDADKDGIPDACDKEIKKAGSFEDDCKHIVSVEKHWCKTSETR